MNNSDISKIVNTIIEIEKKHSLLEWRIDSVFAWQSARVFVYTTIMDLIIPKNTQVHTITKFTKLKVLYRRCFTNSFLHNPFLDFNQSESLVFDSGRKYLTNGKYVDIYTADLCEELDQQSVSYKKYETNYLADNLAPRSYKVKHIDFILLFSKILSKFVRVSYTDSDIKQIRLIESEFNSNFHIELDIDSLFKREIKRFKSQYPLYKLLFRIKKPKSIYLTNSNNKSALIKAAKDSKITTFELQHGLIVKEDLIAHFPFTQEDSLAYFPDKFVLWKDLNMCTSKLPLSHTNIINKPNRHFQNIQERNLNIIRKKNQILIVSQPYFSKEILDFVLKNAKELPNWEFIYKIHPVEDPTYHQNQKDSGFPDYNNISFVTNNVSIYNLFSESSYAIGVFSTAVFEAPYFGCKTLLLNIPGVEMASTLLENKRAVLINLEESLQTYLH